MGPACIIVANFIKQLQRYCDFTVFHYLLDAHLDLIVVQNLVGIDAVLSIIWKF